MTTRREVIGILPLLGGMPLIGGSGLEEAVTEESLTQGDHVRVGKEVIGPLYAAITEDIDYLISQRVKERETFGEVKLAIPERVLYEMHGSHNYRRIIRDLSLLLQHPELKRVYDTGNDNQPWAVMSGEQDLEFMDNGELSGAGHDVKDHLTLVRMPLKIYRPEHILNDGSFVDLSAPMNTPLGDKVHFGN